MGLLSLFRRHTFEHGVHPVDHKDLTNRLPIRRLAFAPRLLLPLSQHRGAPSRPLVSPGQEVVRGEPIAQAEGFVSVPLHAPASGVIRAIEPVATAEGPKTQAIVLDVYEAASQEVLYERPCRIAAWSGRAARPSPAMSSCAFPRGGASTPWWLMVASVSLI
jgi:electron transport complex protein RnfC